MGGPLIGEGVSAKFSRLIIDKYDESNALKEKGGHIQMWDGKKWGSDFEQPADDFWPGKSYRANKPCYSFFRYFMILIFILIGLGHAQDPGIDKAKCLLDTLYGSLILNGRFFDTGFDYGNKDVTSKYFSSEMVELLLSERNCNKETGEICRLDWNVLCDCQDMTDKFSITFKVKSVKPIQILAKITDVGNTSELQFNFIVENEMIKISDIIRTGKHSYSLKKLLLKPF
jgi:hypothetical protein